MILGFKVLISHLLERLIAELMYESRTLKVERLLLWFHCREQEYILDRWLSCHEDGKAVDTDTNT